MQPETRKITAQLPAALIAQAQAATGANLTETLCLALQKLTEDEAYDTLSALQGQYKPNIDLKSLREDRPVP